MKRLPHKALLVFSLFLSLGVCAQENQTLRAGLFYIVPFGYVDSDTGEVTGITASLIQAIESESNMPISIKLVPYKRLIASLEQGSIDFAIFFRSEITDQVSDSLLPVYDLDTVVMTRSSFVVNQYEDLYALRLATPVGVRYSPKFDKDEKLRVNRVEDYSNAVLMLDKGFVDGVVGPEKILSYQLNAHKLDTEMFSNSYTLTTNTAWLQFSKKFNNESVKQRVIKSVEALKASGKVSEILEYSFD